MIISNVNPALIQIFSGLATTDDHTVRLRLKLIRFCKLSCPLLSLKSGPIFRRHYSKSRNIFFNHFRSESERIFRRASYEEWNSNKWVKNDS